MRLVRQGPSVLARLAVVLGALALAGAARGEEIPLTLAEALSAADRQNPELIAARERALAQEARAEAVSLPKVTVSSGWSRTDNPPTSSRTSSTRASSRRKTWRSPA